MTKYIDADRLRAEIEERKQIHFNDYFVKKSGNPADYGASNALAQVLPLIDSLQQEQPETKKMEGFIKGLCTAGANYQEGYFDGYSAAEKEIYKDLKDKMEKHHASQVDYGVHIEHKPTNYTRRNELFDQCVKDCDPKVMKEVSDKVDIENEIDACWQNWLSPSNQKEVEGVLPKTEFAMYARHFYKLGKEGKR